MIVSAEVAAEGLGFPEGPLVLPDGRLAFVEMYRGQISVLEDGKVRQLAHLGGSPNGLALGADGRIWVARPEGRVGEWVSGDGQPAAIAVVDPADGRFELATEEASGQRLRAPNDLCFGPDGALYFTDPCAVDPDGDFKAWICRLDEHGCEILHELDNVFPNGIGFDLDGRLVWAETHTERLVTVDGGALRTLAQLPAGHSPDGFAYTSDGRCVVAVYSGGLDVVDWSGGEPQVEQLVWADNVLPVNVAFEGSTLWVTDATPEWTDPDVLGGRLWRLETELTGAPVGPA